MHAAVVEAVNMPARHAEIHAANLHVRHLLRLDDGVPNVLGLRVYIHDLAFAHATRARLSHADDIKRALRVHLAGHGAYFRGADLQTNDDGRGIKHASSCRVRPCAASKMWAAPPRFRASARAHARTPKDRATLSAAT